MNDPSIAKKIHSIAPKLQRFWWKIGGRNGHRLYCVIDRRNLIYLIHVYLLSINAVAQNVPSFQFGLPVS
jgi:hypothetical protein